MDDSARTAFDAMIDANRQAAMAERIWDASYKALEADAQRLREAKARAEAAARAFNKAVSREVHGE